MLIGGHLQYLVKQNKELDSASRLCLPPLGLVTQEAHEHSFSLSDHQISLPFPFTFNSVHFIAVKFSQCVCMHYCSPINPQYRSYQTLIKIHVNSKLSLPFYFTKIKNDPVNAARYLLCDTLDLSFLKLHWHIFLCKQCRC